MKENLKYNGQFHVLNGPQPPGNGPAEEDLGFETPEPSVKPVTSARKTYKTRRALKDVLGGDYLSKEWVTGNISFIFYIAFLAMIYIANTYYTEKKFKAIENTKTELKELRYKYITTKSILMFQGRQSEISKRAIIQGLHEAKMPPFKILYAGESLQPTKK